MKTHVMRFGLLCLLLSINSHLFAQDPFDEFKNQMDNIFQYVDKSKVETGILIDYGYLPIEPAEYNGIPADGNYVNMDVWKQLYIGMYASQINMKANLGEPQNVKNGADCYSKNGHAVTVLTWQS